MHGGLPDGAGVEEDQLLLEERSHNTDQNLRYSRELLEAEGCDLSEGWWWSPTAST